MPLSTEEKARRKRDRMLAKATEYQIGTYIAKFVAPVFQKMIRAEAAADPRPFVTAVIDGRARQVRRQLGQCVCVTCGRVNAWDSGITGMHTGHFVASRRFSILFEEDNVAPQCAHCNYYRNGYPQAFREWMIAVRGLDTVEHLLKQRLEVRTFSRDELVDMRIRYQRRLVAAQEAMKV